MLTTSNERVKCLFLDLTYKSRSVQFICLSLTLLFFHITQGYMHELIFRLDGFKPFSMFLTLLQFFFYAFLAYLEIIFSNGIRYSFRRNRKYDAFLFFIK